MTTRTKKGSNKTKTEQTSVTVELTPLKAKIELRFDPKRELCTSTYYNLEGEECSGSVSNLSKRDWNKFIKKLYKIKLQK